MAMIMPSFWNETCLNLIRNNSPINYCINILFIYKDGLGYMIDMTLLFLQWGGRGGGIGPREELFEANHSQPVFIKYSLFSITPIFFLLQYAVCVVKPIVIYLILRILYAM